MLLIYSSINTARNTLASGLNKLDAFLYKHFFLISPHKGVENYCGKKINRNLKLTIPLYLCKRSQNSYLYQK